MDACASTSSTPTSTTPANSTFTGVPTVVAVAAFDARNPTGRGDIEQPGGTAPSTPSRDRLHAPPAVPQLSARPRVAGRQPHRQRERRRPVDAATYQAGAALLRAAPPARRRLDRSTSRRPTRRTPATAPPVPTAGWAAPRWTTRATSHVGFSASSTTLTPAIIYAGRLAADPATGCAQGEATLIAGAGVQTARPRAAGATTASMNVDPVDDCTFWYTQEYYTATSSGNWATPRRLVPGRPPAPRRRAARSPCT